MEYLLHVLILIEIYIILSVSLNLVVGHTGLLSIAHAAFYGVGAYVAALMALHLHSSFMLNVLCAIILSGFLGFLIGIPSIRIRDDYFVIATFAFQVITFSVLNNLVEYTGGPTGLPGIPHPVIFNIEVSSRTEFLLLYSVFCVLSTWISNRIVSSPIGRVLKAIREDEIFTQSVGKNVVTYKILIFVFGAGIASISGVMYAYYISFIDPTSFTVMESIFIISIIIIGGIASKWGPLLGSVILVILPEILRFVGLPSTLAANLRQIIYGGLLVVFLMWYPNGIVGEFSSRTEESVE